MLFREKLSTEKLIQQNDILTSARTSLGVIYNTEILLTERANVLRFRQM